MNKNKTRFMGKIKKFFKNKIFFYLIFKIILDLSSRSNLS